MAIKMYTVKCPECGAALEYEEGRTTMFCTYCGAKIILNNENEYVYRHIDEAGVKHAETERMVRLKQIEYASQKYEDNKRVRSLKIKVSLILLAAGLLMMVAGYGLGNLSGNGDSAFYMLSMIGFFPLMGSAYIWLFSKDKEDDDIDFSDKVKVPAAIGDYEEKDYRAVETILKGAGFTNISCVPLNDLSFGILTKPGKVDSITINGNEISCGKKYPREAVVVVSYHSMKN